MQHCANARSDIAELRGNKYKELFGQKRTESAWTFIHKNKNKYGYALDRAINIQYDDCFANKCSDHTRKWMGNVFHPFDDDFRYGLVLGAIKGVKIELTQYVFSPFFDDQNLNYWFGPGPDNYVSGAGSGIRKESAVWLHTAPGNIDQVMDHIGQLINEAIQGDLTVIPKIHWWYVHLAPDNRGSGGIAEMIISILCRSHGIDLPAWKEGVAPSVEVLLEPSEEVFCKRYHELFATNRSDMMYFFNPALSGNQRICRLI